MVVLLHLQTDQTSATKHERSAGDSTWSAARDSIFTGKLQIILPVAETINEPTDCIIQASTPENLSLGFRTKRDSNQSTQPQKLPNISKFCV